MTKNIQFITVGALLLGGCSVADHDTFDLPDSAEDAQPALAQEAELAAPESSEAQPLVGSIDKQCYGAPVVARLFDADFGSCDLDGALPEGWTGSSLFASGSPKVESLPNPVPSGLANYCRFEFDGSYDWGDGYTALLNAVADYDFLEYGSVAADCLAYAPMGDGLEHSADVHDSLREAYASSLDLPEASELAGEIFYDVAVRVLDTADEGFVAGGGTPINQHGVQMENIMTDVICAAGVPDCELGIEQVMVTPRDDKYRPTWDEGQDLGVLSDFALGVYFAVQDWLNNPHPKGHQRLILNASVGADLYALYAMDPNRGSLRATIEVLEWASCYGVIVVGASGNVRDESCDLGENNMLVPAAFESFDALSPGTCDDRGFWPTWDTDIYPVFPPPGVTRPLVYAAGGVGFDDLPNPNARGASMPRLTAPAANALPSVGEEPLTGSSLAAAVTTATARLGWGLDPSLRPDQLMDLIYAGSYVTPYAAEDGRWVGWTQHRLSVCGALSAIGAPVSCHMPAPNPTGLLANFVGATMAAIADPSNDVIEYLEGVDDDGSCQGVDLFETVVPQPEIPICAVCSAGIVAGGWKNDRVYVDIDDSYKGQIVGTKLIKSGMDVTFKQSVIDEMNSVSGPDVQVVYFNGDITWAMLEFTLADGSVQTNSIPVYNL